MAHKIVLTVDVEDWFQVENLKGCIPFSSWDKRELRVERNTHLLLDLFDSCSEKRKLRDCKSSDITVTFFVLGWIAEKLPHLVREIHERGHEVASHGYFHYLCTACSQVQLREELIRSKEYLEDIIGVPVVGFRAPSFSVSNTILETIRVSGYRYDSSYNSFDINERYGRVSLESFTKYGVAYEVYNDFYELPVSNICLGRAILPWAGGGYFRLIPFPVFKRGVNYILERDGVYVFYIHPWEIDYKQPRVDNLPAFFKFRHYINLQKTLTKLRSFICTFPHCQFVSCKTYLASVATE